MSLFLVFASRDSVIIKTFLVKASTVADAIKQLIDCNNNEIQAGEEPLYNTILSLSAEPVEFDNKFNVLEIQ